MKTITKKLKGVIYMKYYRLTEEQEERFSILAREKKELITKGLYKVKVPKSLHREFYSFGLEGLLVSFLIHRSLRLW